MRYGTEHVTRQFNDVLSELIEKGNVNWRFENPVLFVDKEGNRSTICVWKPPRPMTENISILGRLPKIQKQIIQIGYCRSFVAANSFPVSINKITERVF